MPDEPASVKSADRVLDLFEALARWGDRMSHSQLAEALDIPKSSLTQLLRNLTQRGYIDFSPLDKKYRLGAKLLELSRNAAVAVDIVALAAPVLAAISSATRESSALNVQVGDVSEVVAAHNGSHRLLSHMRLGDQAPLYATSSGKLMLAFMGDAQLADYLARVPLEPVTAGTLRSVSALRHQLERAAAEQIAYSFEEFTPGIVGIAVPVISDAGALIAAINVAIPAVRLTDALKQSCIEALKAEAESLRRKLGARD